MFGFEPDEEQRMLVDSVQRYALNDLRAAAHDADEAGELPAALIAKGWELGILQASIPEAYGGFGERSAVTGVLAAEELGWGDLTAGRQAITFGKAYFWNPLDVFFPFDSSQIDREYKPGVDALRIDVPLGAFSGLNLVGAAGRTDAKAGGSRGRLAADWRWRWGSIRPGRRCSYSRMCPRSLNCAGCS